MSASNPATSNISRHSTKWRGIDIEIIHTPNFCAGLDHLEISSRLRVALPITETGYKSLFYLPKQLQDFRSPVEYVLAWLDHEAKSHQLSLF